MIPICAGFGTNQRGPKSDQDKLADLDTLDYALAWIKRFSHFPFDRVSDLEYFNQYSSQIYSIFSLEKLRELQNSHKNI
jgi:hypothetical protein